MDGRWLICGYTTFFDSHINIILIWRTKRSTFKYIKYTYIWYAYGCVIRWYLFSTTLHTINNEWQIYIRPSNIQFSESERMGRGKIEQQKMIKYNLILVTLLAYSHTWWIYAVENFHFEIRKCWRMSMAYICDVFCVFVYLFDTIQYNNTTNIQDSRSMTVYYQANQHIRHESVMFLIIMLNIYIYPFTKFVIFDVRLNSDSKSM